MPEDFMQQITDLSFTGHEDLAFRVIEDSWPKTTPGKEHFVNDYRNALSESQFYPDFSRRLKL